MTATTNSKSPTALPYAVAPLVFDERLMGALRVSSNDPSRVWQENEILLLRTVADQVCCRGESRRHCLRKSSSRR